LVTAPSPATWIGGRRGECRSRPGDETAFRLEGQHRGGLAEPDPADLVELVVMTGQVAADRLHQEVVDRLVDSRAGLDEPVLDRIEDTGDADGQAGLFGDFAEGRLLAGLADVRRPLRKGPGATIALPPAAADDEPRPLRVVADDDPAG
jgi:hypothetical protein